MAACSLPAAAAGPGPGQTRAQYLARLRESKARAVELMSQGARQRMATARDARRRGGAAGAGQRPLPVNEDGARPSYAIDVAAQRYSAHTVATVPPNVRVSQPAGDRSNTAQSGGSIAALGDRVLVAWNDGLGPQHLGWAWSRDGGRSFTDGGAPPGPSGWTWWSDPVVTVNERTGTFYLCGLVDANATTNGVAVVPVTFTGTTPVWGAPVLVRSARSATTVFDQPWLVADSTSGHLHLTCTTFGGPAGARIDHQRSTDGGVTWSPPARISAVADEGRVQGSRMAVGPDGELYAVWSAIGTGPEDHLRVRRSLDRGVTWGTAATAAAYHANFGTGAPGSNRERGSDLPSIAVDRTAGAERGRVHLAWTDGLDRYDDALNTLGTRLEAEGNDVAAAANPFIPGERLRGALAGGADTDWFSFPAAQGTTYLFECDSIPNPLYTLRVFCGQDTVTRLAFAGDLDAPAGGGGYLMWTAPSSGPFFLRIASVPGGAPGGYRISTGVAGVGVERGRDARDVFAAWSTDGSAWSGPVRVNDAPAGHGESLPEIQVAADGMPYVTWFDWRDDRCGGRSYQYLARSSDGGATWSANRRFSDVQNDWTSISLGSDLAPGMGDRGHLAADARYLRPAWADGRGGNPDLYTTRVDTGFDLSICQGDLAADPGSSLHPAWTVTNRNPLLPNTYGWTLSSRRGWPLPPVGAAAAAADGPVTIVPAIAIPDTAAPGVNRVCLTVTDARGVRSRSCCFDVTVQPAPAGVPVLVSAFDLRPGVPHPATHRTRIDFSLPDPGPVRLRIYGLRGDVVRTLADGTRPAGPHTVTWDGRDERGSRVGAGAYFCRLEGFGNVRVQRLLWLR